MSFGRSAALLFLGVLLGIGLTIGTYYGVRQYAPGLISLYLGRALGASPVQGGPGTTSAPIIDSGAVKSIVQDILASEQGKAIVNDLIQSQSRESLDALFAQAMQSPEFRRALSDILSSFLKTEEGKNLLRSIAKDIMTP